MGAAVNDQLIGGGIELAADKAEVIPRAAMRRQVGAQLAHSLPTNVTECQLSDGKTGLLRT